MAVMMVFFLVACAAPSIPVIPSETSSPTTSPTGKIPSITPTSSPTPTPTVTPEARLKTGEQALFEGDYLLAQTEYQAALSTATDAGMRAMALWGLGRVEYAAGNNGKALIDLSNLASIFPDSPNGARAYFIMGDIYNSLERFSEAVQAYTKYLALRPGILDSLAQERLGDALFSSGSYTEAIVAFRSAITASHIGGDTLLQIKLAQAYAGSGDTNTAIELYDSIAEASSNDYIKAQMDLFAGRLYLSLGQTEQAYQHFLDTVDKYPLAYDSYSALVALVEANIPVNDLSRGLVDYFAGQPGSAVEAFQRFIGANPQNDGTAIYYRALALYDLGQYEESIKSFDEFIQNYPDNPHWAAAWNGNGSLPGRAYIQWYWLDQYDLAAQNLLGFIKLAPADPNAPIYLMEAARIQERAGKLEEAAITWERIADEYPSHNFVPQSLFWAGIVRIRSGNYGRALLTFQRDLQLSSEIEDQARAYLWIGKTQQIQGDNNSAQISWQQGAALDPTDYYSLRAQDLLLKRPTFDPPHAVNYSIDLTTERKQAEAWLRVTFNMPTDTDLSISAALLSDARLVRGTELWNLDLEDEARLEFEDLRAAVAQDPAESYRLANYMLELGLYRPAITAMRQVLTLAGMTSQSRTLAAPAYFNHVRYGFYYQDLLVPAAQEAEFDPLFMYSVMRQESLFEGFVQSTAGARGLMQITPDTGQFISDNLDWPPDYTSNDLYRPMISITLGTTYLAKQRFRFDDDLFTALAAYNAGPEAASIWRELSGPDSDLFVEVIRIEETRNYIRSIYEAYNMYRSLYESIP